MSRISIGLAAALALSSALSLGGAAAAQQIPKVADPARCDVGQPEIRPLQPLSIVTPKGKTDLLVEYADNDRTRQTGLMCRRSLAPDRGMLFDFKRPMPALGFWMRNTLIPLDLVYIRPDGRVLSIVRNARPLSDAPLPANGVARWVLELSGGRAAQLGLLPGDRIVHKTMPAR